MDDKLQEASEKEKHLKQEIDDQAKEIEEIEKQKAKWDSNEITTEIHHTKHIDPYVMHDYILPNMAQILKRLVNGSPRV
jgi:5'-3' exonuclease